MKHKTSETAEKILSSKAQIPSGEGVVKKEIHPPYQGEKDFWVWLKDAEHYSSKLELR